MIFFQHLLVMEEQHMNLLLRLRLKIQTMFDDFFWNLWNLQLLAKYFVDFYLCLLHLFGSVFKRILTIVKSNIWQHNYRTLHFKSCHQNCNIETCAKQFQFSLLGNYQMCTPWLWKSFFINITCFDRCSAHRKNLILFWIKYFTSEIAFSLSFVSVDVRFFAHVYVFRTCWKLHLWLNLSFWYF